MERFMRRLAAAALAVGGGFGLAVATDQMVAPAAAATPAYVVAWDDDGWDDDDGWYGDDDGWYIGGVWGGDDDWDDDWYGDDDDWDDDWDDD